MGGRNLGVLLLISTLAASAIGTGYLSDWWYSKWI